MAGTKYIDLTNQKIGRLKVLYLSDKRGNRGQYYWVCQCECGVTKDINQSSLKMERIKSCGCLLKEFYQKLPQIAAARNSLPKNESAFNDLYNSYKYRSKKNNYEFDLDKNKFKALTSDKCYYCGIEPYKESKTKNGIYRFNGIDRIDSSIGYTIENSRPCCEICNKAKRDLAEDVFYSWIQRLGNFNKSNILNSERKLYQGFIKVVDMLGSDITVVNAARVSFGKRVDFIKEKDLNLMQYLSDNNHTSPFRHIFVQFHIKAPEFIARQWWKHIIGGEYTFKDTAWNEISGRYVDYDNELWVPDNLREQNPDKKQGSLNTSVENEQELLYLYKQGSEYLFDLYEHLLGCGVSNEQARTILPLNFYTEWYWTASLQAIAHFVKLRNSVEAQKEITEYAQNIDDIMCVLLPNSWKIINKKY